MSLEALGRNDEGSTELARADAEFRLLADRIADPSLRAWFERTGERPAVQRETQAMLSFLQQAMAQPAAD